MNLTKNQNLKSRWILAAAVAAVSVGAFALPTTIAQVATGQNGHATDVNTRIGSGGYNTGGLRPPVNPNDIVTDNVTGGRGFRGVVPYTAPGAFRGTLPGSGVDSFVSQSAGVPLGAYSNNNSNAVTPFFGQSYGAPPPTGFGSTVTSNGQYLPNTPLVRTAGDARVGDLYTNNQYPSAGQSILPGPVDSATNQATVITASPLYGVRTWTLGDNSDQQFLNTYADINGGGRHSSQLNNLQIDRARAELQLNDGRPQQVDANGQPLNPRGDQNKANGSNATDAKTSQGASDRNTPVDASVQQPQANNAAVQNQPIDAASNNAALTDAMGTTGIRNRLTGNQSQKSQQAISENSPAVQELNRRLAVYKKGGAIEAETEANDKFQAERRAAEAAKNAANGNTNNAPNNPANNASNPKSAAPGTNTPVLPSKSNGAEPKTTQPPLPGVQPAQPQPGTATEQPLMVDSFSKDMKPSAVTTFMTDAEKLMKDGKYTSALDKYDLVDQVAPNDPLALLGRATAELGASYYSRADAHLRDAFTRNPALLHGQYDLRVFLGNERLNYLIKDLKDIARSDTKTARPAFLLSYIYYNVGDERRAAGYLDLAERRGGTNDPFYRLLRQHWSLPSDAGPADDMNK